MYTRNYMAGINYVKSDDTPLIAKRIGDYLNRLGPKDKILLLLSGGSAISLEVEVVKRLNHPRNFTLSLVDERYVAQGAEDSNWRQLQAKGLTDCEANLAPILNGLGLAETIHKFNNFLELSNKNFDNVVAILGMGADGHTAGILAGSAAVTSEKYVVGYAANDFIRITTTPSFLVTIDKAYVFARGASKKKQIENLSEEVDISVQPAQVFKKIREVEFFNEYKGAAL